MTKFFAFLEQFARLYDDGMVVLDEHKNLLIGNDNFFNLFKLPKPNITLNNNQPLKFANFLKNDERANLFFAKIIDALDAIKINENSDKINLSEEIYEDVNGLKNLTVKLSKINIDSGFVFLIRINDVSNLVVEREKKRDQESFHETILKNLPLGIIKTDLNGECNYINDYFIKLAGINIVSNSKIDWISTILHEDRLIINNYWNDFINGESDSFEHVFRIQNAQNNVAWVRSNGKIVKSDFGEVVGYICTFYDITTIFEIENKLKLEQRFNQKIIQIIPFIVYIYNFKENRFKYVNEHFEKIFEYPSSYLLERDFSAMLNAVIDEEDKLKVKNHWDQILNLTSGRAHLKEFRAYNKNKSLFYFNSSVFVFKKDEDGKTVEVIGFVEDVTHNKELEQKLEKEKLKNIQAFKLAALGEMASGIAHEINNPLVIISGRASQMKKMITLENINKDTFNKALDDIVSTSFRISKIIKGLRSFAGSGSMDELVPKKIQTILNDTIDLCKEKFSYFDISLKVIFNDNGNEVMTQGMQISQVITNLLNNAFDAARDNDDKWIIIETLTNEQNGTVDISITDSGKGIPKDVAVKLFQPFFTTKPVGKGTGLGLSISKGIIEEHGGEIFIDDNSPNTKFVIRLPFIK